VKLIEKFLTMNQQLRIRLIIIIINNLLLPQSLQRHRQLIFINWKIQMKFTPFQQLQTFNINKTEIEPVKRKKFCSICVCVCFSSSMYKSSLGYFNSFFLSKKKNKFIHETKNMHDEMLFFFHLIFFSILAYSS